MWPVSGQNRVRRVLENSIDKERISHAYLFSGDRGLGKFDVACWFAATLLGVELSEGGSNALLNHPDFALVEPTDDRKAISLPRDIRPFWGWIASRPVQAAYRVAVINTYDELSFEARPSLLKTLEDPPPDAVLIVLANSGQSVLATVASRCQQLTFQQVGAKDIEAWLVAHQGMDAVVARSAAVQALGNPARAMQIATSAEWRDDRDLAVQCIQVAAGSSLSALFSLAGKVNQCKDRDGLGSFLTLLSWLLRDVFVAGAGLPQELIVNQDIADDIFKVARQFDPGEIMGCLEYSMKLTEHLRSYVNMLFVIELLLLRIKDAALR